MNEAEVIVDDKVPVVRIIREFDAPVAKVFRAHVEPELFAKWNWPEGYSVQFNQYDCRTGGAYRIAMSGPEMEGSVHGSFHDVIPNELIVQTFAPDGAGDFVSWRSIASRTWATAAQGSPRSRSSRASSTATRSSTPACSRATTDSTTCSRSCRGRHRNVWACSPSTRRCREPQTGAHAPR